MKLWHFGVFFSLYILYHLLTLSISPIVWTDEVAFNSMTLDWIMNGKYRMLCDLQYVHGGNALAYGPVWFYLNGLIINIFNSPFCGRLLGLISGILLILLFIKWFNIDRKQIGLLTTLLFVAFCLDPFLIANIHRGRNDTLAIFFFYFSNYFLLKSYSNSLENKFIVNYKFVLMSSLMFSLATLTTARIIMLSPATLLVFIYYLFQSKFSFKYIKSGLVWALIVGAFYSCWIFYGFGGFQEYIDYYSKINSRNSSFVGGNFFIPIEVKPLLICFLLSIFILIINYKNQKLSAALVFCVGVVICFYFLVGDTGPYSVYVIPAFYLWISIILNNVIFDYNKKIAYFKYLIAIILLGFNSLIFCLKSTVLISDASSRNTETVNEFIEKNIPLGAKVCGDEVYYYSALNNKNPFHLIVSYQTEIEYDSVELYSRINFDYDYLIVSKRIKERCPKLVELYITKSNMQPIDTLQLKHNKISTLLAPVSGYNLSTSGYDGIIYKRIK